MPCLWAVKCVISIQYPTRDRRVEEAPHPEGEVYEPCLQTNEPIEINTQRTKRGLQARVTRVDDASCSHHERVFLYEKTETGKRIRHVPAVAFPSLNFHYLTIRPYDRAYVCRAMAIANYP